LNGEYDKAFEQALRFLRYSDRTVHEMKDKLREKGFSEETVAHAVNRLKKLGLLDDSKFTERWIHGKIRSRPIGKRLIQQQLRLKGIHPEVISEMLEPIYDEFAESDRINNLVKKQMAKYKKLDKIELRKKLYSFLMRRGFDYEECASAIERAVKSREED
jgi:regulatory protein